jgi:hypothetical protein
MVLSTIYHLRRAVMSFQMVIFATVKGIVQKTLVVQGNHQDPSAQLFVTVEEELTKSTRL